MNTFRPIVLTAIVLGLATSSALAQIKSSEAAPGGKGSSTAKFDALDADKDGYVSRTEAERAKGLPEAFDQADASKDGKLDAAEFEAIQKR
ncbi:MAG: hypothetical protein WBP72_10820 [Rhodocyclaceae bacterium]|jgi:hypothetical protein